MSRIFLIAAVLISMGIFGAFYFSMCKKTADKAVDTFKYKKGADIGFFRKMNGTE